MTKAQIMKRLAAMFVELYSDDEIDTMIAEIIRLKSKG